MHCEQVNYATSDLVYKKVWNSANVQAGKNLIEYCGDWGGMFVYMHDWVWQMVATCKFLGFQQQCSWDISTSGIWYHISE